jgi:hypothetical protein
MDNMPARPRVFICHSHEDNEVTERVVADLRAAGVDVWIDTAEIAHDDFQDRINAGLMDRDWLILIETPEALHSPWVRREVNAALQLKDQGRLRDVIPLVVKPCVSSDVPPLWAILHHYDATVDYPRALQGLLRAVSLNSPTTGPVAPRMQPGAPMPPGTPDSYRDGGPVQAQVYPLPYTPPPAANAYPQPAPPGTPMYSPYPAPAPQARKAPVGWIIAAVAGGVVFMCICILILVAITK